VRFGRVPPPAQPKTGNDENYTGRVRDKSNNKPFGAIGPGHTLRPRGRLERFSPPKRFTGINFAEPLVKRARARTRNNINYFAGRSAERGTPRRAAETRGPCTAAVAAAVITAPPAAARRRDGLGTPPGRPSRRGVLIL